MAAGSSSGSVHLRGVALHRGGPAGVRLSRHDGPIALGRGDEVVPLQALVVERTDRGVRVASVDGGLRVDLIEHLLAAIGGLGIAHGLLIEPDTEELPLLDGGAAEYVAALEALDLPVARALEVARDAAFEHGPSRYRFSAGASPEVCVTVDFPPPVGRQDASWSGDTSDFRTRIAPARTFGWRHELEALRRSGRAASVDLASVIVFDERGLSPGCSLAGDDEPARHKLLDLIGDLTLYGGPPCGRVEAFFPGHTASHAVARAALEALVLRRRGDTP